GGRRVHPGRGGLPGLDVLGLPQAHQRAAHPEGDSDSDSDTDSETGTGTDIGPGRAGKPLHPRLRRDAPASPRYLVTCVALGVAGAALIVAQATLLASGITAVFLGGGHSGGRSVHGTLLGLAAVVAGRALVAWAQEVAAHRAAAAVKSQLRGRLLAHLV